jgi:hypothetical protein
MLKPVAFSVPIALIVACGGAGSSGSGATAPGSSHWSQLDQGRRAITECKRTHDLDSTECKLTISLGHLSVAEQQQLRDAAGRDVAQQRLAELTSEPCSRERAKQELALERYLSSGKASDPTANDVHDKWEGCVKAQLQRCQQAVDKSIDDGLSECAVSASELPSDLLRAEIDAIVPCLRQVKAEQNAARDCIANTEANKYGLRCPSISGQATCGRTRLAERFACLHAPQTNACPIIGVANDWMAFRSSNDLDAAIEEARSAACGEQIDEVSSAVRAADVPRAENSLKDASISCTSDEEKAKLAELREQLPRVRLIAQEKVARREAPPKRLLSAARLRSDLRATGLRVWRSSYADAMELVASVTLNPRWNSNIKKGTVMSKTGGAKGGGSAAGKGTGAGSRGGGGGAQVPNLPSTVPFHPSGGGRGNAPPSK